MKSEFIPKTTIQLSDSGSVTWQAPSNIAIIKYWGKQEVQIPINPSISFTLKNCFTKTTVSYTKNKLEKRNSFDFKIKGERNLKFEVRVQNFLDRVKPYFPFLNHYHLSIETENSFPHSTGIASSASGISALALCLTAIEARYNSSLSEEQFYKKASFIARLGSGSACRSIKGKIVLWGNYPEVKNSSNLYGIPLDLSEVHPIFLDYCNAVLVVDKTPKKVSSTEGHRLVNKHPFVKQRVNQALENTQSLFKVLKKGDVESFISIAEAEALMLHAMMMTSNPYYMLIQSSTVDVIHKVWQLRKEGKLKNLCFTLDAGVNVHLLYPKVDSESYKKIIESELKSFCEDGTIIYDEIGSGAVSLS